MTTESTTIVQRLWNYCNVLRDDGVSYGDYVGLLTNLLFLKMADEIEKELDRGMELFVRLLQSILKQAFEGRLV